MKRILFAIAALAVLAAGCMKEQQPETSSDPVNKPVIVVSVAQTKATISPVEGTGQGKCIWQNGDQLAVYYQNSDATAGEIVKFTYSEGFEDGSAKFVAETAPTDGYTPVRVAHPVSSVTETGFSLTTEFTYDASDPDRLPLYLRSEKITVNDDGSLSSQLHHNASVLKFTLHDVPAYAAGLAFESVRYKDESGAFVEKGSSVASTTTVKTVTRFPYKTGYTADPASSANDVTLYVAAAHSSYPSRVYLIDGDGDEVEGSAKAFNVADGAKWIGADDYIEFNTAIDFKKSELRKDFVKVVGIKWAKGNLVRDAENTWHSVQTGVDDQFQTGWGLHDEQWKYINWNQSINTSDYDNRYNINHDKYFDVFAWGGIGRQSSYRSGRLVPQTANYDISKKVFWGYVNTDDNLCNPENLTLLEGDACFSSELSNGNSVYTKEGETKGIAGDVAYWASKGKYCMPQKALLQSLSHPSSSKASFQYGKYEKGDYTVYGYLYTTPQGEVVRSNEEVTFTDADLESGLFLPLAGRRGNTNNQEVINQRNQAIYRSSTFGNPEHATYGSTHPECATSLWFDGASLPSYGFTNGKATEDDGYSSICTLSNAAGGCIRPVLVEAEAE